MRPWIKRTLYGLFGATLVVGSLSACSHRLEGHGGQASAEDQARWRGKMVDRVASKLDLDGAQKQRLATLADTLHAQRLALAGANADPRAQMQALVAGEKFDRARAQALVNEKTAAVGAKSPEVIAAMGDFYDSLRPEQQARVRDFMQRRGGWWHRG
jgi:protein CpxP